MILVPRIYILFVVGSVLFIFYSVFSVAAQIRTDPNDPLVSCKHYEVITLTENGLECICLFGEEDGIVCNERQITCSGDTILVFDDTGTPVCNPISGVPLSFTNCQEDQYLAGIFRGVSQCYSLPELPLNCGENQLLSYIDDDYTCVDRVTTTIPVCSAHELLVGNEDGTDFVCQQFPCSAPYIVPKGKITSGSDASLISPINVVVRGKYAYVVSSGSNTFEIINVSNPDNPVFVSKLEAGQGGASLRRPQALVLKGDYAFVVSAQSDSIESIDISDPNNPVHIDTLQNHALLQKLDGPVDIVIKGDYAYVASYYSDAIEIVNISDPANLTHAEVLTKYETGVNLDGVNNLVIKDNLLFATAAITNVLKYYRYLKSNQSLSCRNDSLQ